MSKLLKSISLNYFRSYESSNFELSPTTNIVFGPNAIGKTNLLEAIYLACSGSGFRSKSDSELIKHESDWSRVNVQLHNNERVIKLEKKSDNSRLRKTFEIDGQIKSRLNYDDLIPVVLFEPDIMRLMNGSPDRRRQFLDRMLCQVDSQYKKQLARYMKALSQRNALLKSIDVIDNNQIFALNVLLAEAGDILIQSRLRMVETFNNLSSDIYSAISGVKHNITIKYLSNISTSNYLGELLRGLERNIKIDHLKGYTSLGPHRDDLFIEINGKSLREVASRGENRTMLLTLKKIEINEVAKARDVMPILLLDDVFSELDKTRRKYLIKELTGMQSIITTTDADIASDYGRDSIRLINL